MGFSNLVFVCHLQSDSVSYFFDEIERIAKPRYVPSQKDILHCRKATKGVYEFTIRIKVFYNEKKKEEIYHCHCD